MEWAQIHEFRRLFVNRSWSDVPEEENELKAAVEEAVLTIALILRTHGGGVDAVRHCQHFGNPTKEGR